MRKKLINGLAALAIVIGGGTAITMTSIDVHACDDCKVKGKEQPERVCGSCKKKGMSKTGSEFKNGSWHVNYKCDHCGHTTVYKTKNMYEI
ncbi:MAG: hypothetical protein K2L46_03550 [Paramuribaculum sp.]|nr:hypothetical protein [Paramuribaculum sp.]